MNLISASICSVGSPEIEEETLAADCRGGRGDAGGVGGRETIAMKSIQSDWVTNFKDGKTLNVLELHPGVSGVFDEEKQGI